MTVIFRPHCGNCGYEFEPVFYDPAIVGPNVILHTDNHSPEEIAAQIEEVLEA